MSKRNPDRMPKPKVPEGTPKYMMPANARAMMEMVRFNQETGFNLPIPEGGGLRLWHAWQRSICPNCGAGQHKLLLTPAPTYLHHCSECRGWYLVSQDGTQTKRAPFDLTALLEDATRMR